MKNISPLLIPMTIIIILSACNEKKISREEVDRIGQAQYERNNALMVELDLYLSHAQKCKTEYEVEACS